MTGTQIAIYYFGPILKCYKLYGERGSQRTASIQSFAKTKLNEISNRIKMRKAVDLRLVDFNRTLLFENFRNRVKVFHLLFMGL